MRARQCVRRALTDPVDRAGRELRAKLPGMQFEHLVLPRGLLGRAGVVGKVRGNGKGRHGEDLFVAHQPHGFRGELVGMIDGSDARPGGVERARLAGRVDRHTPTHARSFFDGGAQLGFGVLVRR